MSRSSRDNRRIITMEEFFMASALLVICLPLGVALIFGGLSYLSQSPLDVVSGYVVLVLGLGCFVVEGAVLWFVLSSRF